MARGFPQYFNNKQLERGIKIEMSYGLDRATAERVARQKLAQSPRYYERVGSLTPVLKQDRRRFRRLAKKKIQRQLGGDSPYNQGSPFKGLY
jgi:hypothetical protein